jgi:glycosyltransferase involved in cell wall biosynthesis
VIHLCTRSGTSPANQSIHHLRFTGRCVTIVTDRGENTYLELWPCAVCETPLTYPMRNDSEVPKTTGIPLRIIYVNADFPPISGSGVWRALAMSKYMARRGHRITVIAAVRSNWHLQTDPSLVAQIEPGIEVERIDAVYISDVKRFFSRIRRRLGFSRLVRRVVDAVEWRAEYLFPDAAVHWGLRAVWRASRLSRKQRFDCVITSGPPHVAHFVGWYMKARYGTRWVMDYRDLWTEDVYQLPMKQYHGFLRRLEDRMIASADIISTVSPTLRDLLATRLLPDSPTRCVVIRNGHDIPAGRKPVSTVDRGNRLRVHFNGMIEQPASRSVSFFHALARLRTLGLDDEELPYCTFTGLPEDMHDLVRELDLEGVVHDVGYLSKADSLAQCERADVLLIVVNATQPISAGVVPAKTYEYMALGRHILALLPVPGDASDILKTFEGATVCHVDDVDSIATSLSFLINRWKIDSINRPSEIDEMQRCAQAFSRETQARILLDHIDAFN